MIDSLSRHPAGARFDADVCIVGAGPAGLAIAGALADSDVRLLLVESGDVRPRERDQELNRGESAGQRFEGLHRGRVRAVGGSSWAWAGQLARLQPVAFARRPWVPASGWPFPVSEVAPYARQAARFFGLDGPAPGEAEYVSPAAPPPAFDPRVMALDRSRFASPVELARTHVPALRRSATVTALLHATVTQLRLTPCGARVEEAEVTSLDGTRATVSARTFVLACGGIENARLLMLSGDLGRRLPALGRYFQDHLLVSGPEIRPSDRRRLLDQFAAVRRRSKRSFVRMSLAPEEQERAGVLGCDAYVGWEPPAAVVATRRLRRQGEPLSQRAGLVGTAAAGLPGVVAAGMRRARGLSSAPPDGRVWLELRSEQAPTPSSRIRLARSVDALGAPRARVEWGYGEIERRTLRAMVGAIANEFHRLRLGDVHAQTWLDGETWADEVVDAFHHMGTTRMAEDSATGVVDRDCKVHGIDNLFVAGSSVFPASGAATPTLDLVALAIRLADHLKAVSQRP